MRALKISIAQLDYHTGNFEYNTQKIISNINSAKEEGIDLIVFSELCVCGYPPRDFLEFADFIDQCSKAVDEIAAHCVGIAAIVGAPAVNPVVEGKDLFNAAFFLSEGKIKDVRHKTLLPNYDIFDEYRYFEPNREFNIVEYQGCRIALTICEDLWNMNENPMYVLDPMTELAKQQPHVMINIAASPFNKQQAEIRMQVMKDNVQKYKIPLFYVNHIGAQTQLIFDGGSMVLDAKAEIVDTLTFFNEERRSYTLKPEGEGIQVTAHKEIAIQKTGVMDRIHSALVLGIREYFTKQGFSKAILGLSGGIDSAVVLALAAEALGNENVRAILLPSEFSSQHSIDDAIALAENLHIQYDIISIKDAYNSVYQSVQPQFEGLPFSIAEENMQARIRGIILMAMSNKFGYILLNTSNKSEMAVGYGTLYGDMCGGLSVIGDLYKTEVFQLAAYINREREIIPLNTITKPPSAELRPDQKDSDSLPEYGVLDNVLELYIEKRKSPKEIIALGFDEALVKRILKMVNTNEWKRMQAPPVLRVSAKAFGPGRRMPIVAKYLS